MFDYKRLITKSLKAHTLVPDIFGYSLIKMGFADKYLAGQITMYRTYNWLKRKYRKDVHKREQSKNNVHFKMKEDYVWLCWFQGIENAPKVIQDCYASICYWLHDKKIIVITSENYEKYTDFPEHIIKKWKSGIITDTHFSDLLRIELLIRYGGLWLDATTFLTGPLPEYITRNDFFVYRNGWMDMEMINMASWLIYSKYTNNVMLLETREFLYDYWKKYNYLKNYFLLHMFFRIVTDKHKKEWSEVPYFNQLYCHLLMEEMEREYNDIRIEEIKQQTSVHKLTYKFHKNSIYCTANYLSEIYK